MGMTVEEAGHRGGTRTKQVHGHEHYTRIGHLGGTARANKYTAEERSAMSAKGGQRIKQLIEAAKLAEGE